MKHIVQIFAIMLLLGMNLNGASVNQKVGNKSLQYYKKYKDEWAKLPEANKKRVIEAYHIGKKYDMEYTLAATRFLENRGKPAGFKNKDAINKNVHNGYVTYDCGDFGINTMTYLDSIGKKTKTQAKHIAACKELANNKKLNIKMALETYDYGMERYDNNITKAWNYYNTGRDEIINDRIFMMRGIIKVLREELKNS